jgi:hypothetical protein
VGHGYEREFSVSEPRSTVVALFLRDTFRLPVALNIPALSPAVPHPSVATPFDADAACSEWSRWWGQLLEAEEAPRPGERTTGQTLPQAAEFPVLAELVANVRSEALDYSGQRKREEKALRPARILNSVEFGILNEARPRLTRPRGRQVSIRITQLPVDGDFSWPRSQHHLVVSRSTRADSAAYLAALQTALGWSH